VRELLLRKGRRGALRFALRGAAVGDDYLLALADVQRALLVSGDTHVLELRERFPVHAPRAFLELLMRSA
jgi:hypothetical protein